jgi:hypothetical protein
MAEWNPTCKRFVAFFDIMGFKDMVYRNDHKYVADRMETVQAAVGMLEIIGKKALAYKKGTDDSGINTELDSLYSQLKVLPVFFSDSILLVSADDSKESAVGIIRMSSSLLLLSLSNQIPLKGSLAYGEQTSNFPKSLHFGRPLVDAWILQDELHMYGAVLHHSMASYLKEHKMIDMLVDGHVLSNYKIPLKGCSVNHYCLNWTNTLGSNEAKSKEIISKLYDTVSGSTRSYVDNTMEFVNAIEANQPKK